MICHQTVVIVNFVRNAKEKNSPNFYIRYNKRTSNENALGLSTSTSLHCRFYSFGQKCGVYYKRWITAHHHDSKSELSHREENRKENCIDLAVDN